MTYVCPLVRTLRHQQPLLAAGLPDVREGPYMCCNSIWGSTFDMAWKGKEMLSSTSCDVTRNNAKVCSMMKCDTSSDVIQYDKDKDKTEGSGRNAGRPKFFGRPPANSQNRFTVILSWKLGHRSWQDSRCMIGIMDFTFNASVLSSTDK